MIITYKEARSMVPLPLLSKTFCREKLTQCWTILGNRLRRWHSSIPTLSLRLVLAGYVKVNKQ